MRGSGCEFHEAFGQSGASGIRDPQGGGADGRSLQAAHAFLMVNGTTSSVQSMILSVCKAGDKIILPRNVHKSVINALVLCGAVPVYVEAKVNHQIGIVMGVAVEEMRRAMDEHPDAVAVFVNNPTYYGICSDIREIARLAHERGMKVLADEAHGTHLYFGDDLPVSGDGRGRGHGGSFHAQIGGSLTQSSYPSVRGKYGCGICAPDHQSDPDHQRVLSSVVQP